MLGAFALSLPLLGPNRAAVFLTTRFGAHMRQLGPHAALKAIDCGARHKIFIRDIGALEHANGINGIVFEAEVLDHPAARRELQNVIEALRRRRWPLAEAMAKPFALYGLAEDEATGQRLAAEWRLDDYFVEPFEWGRTRLIRNLQQGGRSLCYVGAPRAEATAMKAATLAVAHCPDGLTADTPAQIVLGDKNLTGLVGLFELAAAFEVRQGVNLVTPFGVDLLDVSTTVFLNFSLFFSVVMSHAGLLASAAGSGFAKWEPLPVENSGNSESSPSARVEAESRSISD
jgi:hypothetical protein